MSRLAGTIAVIVALIALVAGCGGDGAAPVPDGNNAHPDNATVAGRVVQADNPQVAFSRAVVTEPSTGRSTETDANGAFTLTGLPAGPNTAIRVEVPRSTDYNMAIVQVPTRVNGATLVNVAVLPVSVGTPTSLTIDPSEATVESGGTIQFGATLEVNGTRVDAQPTWVVGGAQIGNISETGLFGSQAAGTGFVRAIVGGLIREAAVTVTGASAPDISTVLLSASVDNPVPATGGPVTVTAGVTDGNGVAAVHFDFFPQHTDSFTLSSYTPIAGTTPQDGTWRVIYNAPANDNKPGQTGVQAPQRYSVRVRAVDYAGNQAVSTQFYDFSVAGLDAPPPPS